MTRASGDRLVFAGRGWVGGRLRSVVCRSQREGYSLRIDDRATFEVTRHPWRVRLVDPGGEPDDTESDELLEPALVLALALQGTFCLHASAVARGDEAVAFAGLSGAGKSTLAGHSALVENGENGESAWRPGLRRPPAPGAAAGGGRGASPLPPAQAVRRWSSTPPPLPGGCACAQLYLLDEPPADPAAPVEVRDLEPREALLELVSHTVASRLFDRALAARHLRFCSQVPARTAVRRLSFPRRLDRLDEVYAAIAADLRRV